MKTDTTKGTTEAAEGTLFLGADWFDPLEAGVRTRVRRFIEVHTEPYSLLTYATPNFGRVLTDARGENQRVQSAERGGERPQLSTEPVDKQGNGSGRVRVDNLISEVFPLKRAPLAFKKAAAPGILKVLLHA